MVADLPQSRVNDPLRQPDIGIVSQQQFVCARLHAALLEMHVAPDQAVLDASVDVFYRRVLEHDAVLQLARSDHAPVPNRGIRTDVGVGYQRSLADDRRTSHHTADELGPGLHHDASVDTALTVHLTLDPAVEGGEHEAVGVEHGALFAGIDPTALHHL